MRRLTSCRKSPWCVALATAGGRPAAGLAALPSSVHALGAAMPSQRCAARDGAGHDACAKPAGDLWRDGAHGAHLLHPGAGPAVPGAQGLHPVRCSRCRHDLCSQPCSPGPSCSCACKAALVCSLQGAASLCSGGSHRSAASPERDRSHRDRSRCCRAQILAKKVSARAFAEVPGKKGEKAGEVGIEGTTIQAPDAVRSRQGCPNTPEQALRALRLQTDPSASCAFAMTRASSPICRTLCLTVCLLHMCPWSTASTPC